MRVVAKRTLRGFWRDHADSEQPLRAWHDEARAASWDRPSDVKAKYPSASIIANNQVVFNIKGNTYRLVVAFNYRHETGWIKFIGTHAEYDKIDAATVEFR